MRVRIMRNGTTVNTVDVKTGKKDSKFDVIRRIEAMQMTEDVLKTGMLGKTELGINSIRAKEGVWQVSEDNKGAYKFDGAERNLKFDIRMYETGFVLRTGNTGTNLLGMHFEAYLSNLGRTKVHSSPKDSAKVFTSLKTLKDFIEKNKDALSYLVKRYGFEWSIEDANPLSAEDYSDSLSKMTSKKREKEEALRKEVANLLDEVNASGEENRMPEHLPENVTAEDLKAEAIRRMELLDLWENVRNNFEAENIVYMSEAGGIIYDLNDKAKKAVAKVEADGKLVYAVVRHFGNIGETYSVLYVSNRTEEWPYEIPTSKGWVMSYVYNSDAEECSEYGSVQVKPANGGLIRVA